MDKLGCEHHVVDDEAVHDDGHEDDGEVDELEGAVEQRHAEAVDADQRLIGKDEENNACRHLQLLLGEVGAAVRWGGEILHDGAGDVEGDADDEEKLGPVAFGELLCAHLERRHPVLGLLLFHVCFDF